MSIVKQSIEIKLNEALIKSKEYSDKIKTAKTATKTKIYKKKLKKNNNFIAELLIALDKLK